MEILHTPLFWVSVSAAIFAALAYKKIADLFCNTADARADAIRKQLQEAEDLRRQATSLFAEAKERQEKTELESKQIIEEAHAEAERIAEESERKVKETLERRTQLALEKIAAYEHTVADSIRDRVLFAALEAVREVIINHTEETNKDDFAEHALKAAEKRLN